MHRLKARKSEQSNKTEVASNENERQNEDRTKREQNEIVYKHNWIYPYACVRSGKEKLMHPWIDGYEDRRDKWTIIKRTRSDILTRYVYFVASISPNYNGNANIYPHIVHMQMDTNAQ